MVRAKGKKRDDALFNARPQENEKVKYKLVHDFRGNLERTWVRLCSIIGAKETASIFSGVLHNVSREHLFLKGINISNEGVRLDQLMENVVGLEQSAVHAGFMAFSQDVVTLLTDLTGDVLVRKVKPLLQEFEYNMEDG